MDCKLPEIPETYKLLEKIGAGSAGTVYSAKNLETDEINAIKVFNVQEKSGGDAIESEFHLLNNIRHPNILAVLDFGMTSCMHPFWVMPLVEIVEYSDFERLLTRKKVIEYLKQVLHTLDFLHNSKIIHGDLKPDNILIQKNKRNSKPECEFTVKLTDFGMAFLSSAGRGETRGGSFPYMAPECLTRGWIDPRSDLFSLGVTLAELLLGHLPFASMDEYKKLFYQNARITSRKYPDKFMDIGRIADKLMSPDPDKRYLSAMDVLRVLTSSDDHNDKNIPISRGYITGSRFVGRTGVISALNKNFDKLCNDAGKGLSIVLKGVSGTGFTRLLREWDIQCRLKDIECRYYKAGKKKSFEDIRSCFNLKALSAKSDAIENTVRTSESWRKIQGPCIVMVDDAYKADSESRKIFYNLLVNPPEKLLFVCVWLDESEEFNSKVTTIELNDLDTENLGSMICSRFVPVLPESLAEFILNYSGKNTAVINRTIDTFFHLNIISFEKNSWTQKQIPELAGAAETNNIDPEELQLKTLSHQIRVFVMELAFLGRQIDINLISFVLDLSEKVIKDKLQKLRREKIVSVSEGGFELVSPGFGFLAHKLLSDDRQLELHRKIADYLIKTEGNQVEIGQHLLAAGELETGVKNLYFGAVKMLRNGNIDVALGLLDNLSKTIEKCENKDVTASFKWLTALETGNGLLRKGDVKGALNFYKGALDSTDDPGQRSSVMGNLAMARLRDGDHEVALSILKEAVELAGMAKKPAQQGILSAQLGNLYFQRDRLQEAEKVYQSTLPQLEAIGNKRVAGAVWNNLGSVKEMLGDIQGAFNAYTKALPLKIKERDRLGEAILRHNIGHILLERGRIRAAIIQLEAAVSTLKKQGEASHLIQFLGNLALAELYRGNFREAAARLEQADPELREIEDHDLSCWLISIRGKLLTECGNPEAALQLLKPWKDSVFSAKTAGREQVFFISRYKMAAIKSGQISEILPISSPVNSYSYQDPLLICEELLVKGVLAIRTREFKTGEEVYRKVVTIADRHNLFLKKCQALAGIAESLIFQRKPQAALEQLTQEMFEQLKKSGALPIYAKWTALAAVAYDRSGERTASLHADSQAGEIISILSKKLPPETDPDKFRSIFVESYELPDNVRQESIQETDMEDRKKLTLLLEISKGLNQETDLDALMKRIVDHSIELTGADRGFLYLKAVGDCEAILVTRNIDKENIFGSKAQISTSVLDDVMRTNRSVILNDSFKDEHFAQRQSILVHNLRTIMCAPVSEIYAETAGKQSSLAAGVLYVDGTATGPRFSSLDREVFEALASHAGVGLANLQQKRKLTLENQTLKKQVRSYFGFDQLIGTSPAMGKLKSILGKVAPSSASVLVYGESGTGKELVARTLHFNSPRENEAFLSINCAALAESVLESELFGVESGIATGVKRRSGLFMQADKGTLFLDEIGDMPLNMQAKILRVLQEKRVRPIGANKSIDIDVRIICATNKNLWEETKAGRFRKDLLFRLDVISLHLPPLRERVEDIPMLASFFLQKHSREMGVPAPGITIAAYRNLARYAWPGNVRELENQIHRALVLNEIGKDIEPEDFSPRILDENPFPVDMTNENTGGRVDLTERLSSEKFEKEPLISLNLKASVMQMEKNLILEALKKTDGNKTEAARLLGLSREGLRLKIKRLKLTSWNSCGNNDQV